MQLLTTEVSNSAWMINTIVVVIFCPISLKYFLLYLQRTEEVADARTSGSVSPSDFFSQTPNENSNFQIPVSCGKFPFTDCVTNTCNMMSLFAMLENLTAVCPLGIKIRMD